MGRLRAPRWMPRSDARRPGRGEARHGAPPRDPPGGWQPRLAGTISSLRLSRRGADRISRAMRTHPLLQAAVLACLAVPAMAQAPKPPAHPPAVAAPQKLGTFEDWTAATHQELGTKVCYAFTYAAHSVPVLPGRGEVVLTVTERPTGRDEVALSAGFAYAAGATVTVQVDQAGLDFIPPNPSQDATPSRATARRRSPRSRRARRRRPARPGRGRRGWSTRSACAGSVRPTRRSPRPARHRADADAGPRSDA